MMDRAAFELLRRVINNPIPLALINITLGLFAVTLFQDLFWFLGELFYWVGILSLTAGILGIAFHFIFHDRPRL